MIQWQDICMEAELLPAFFMDSPVSINLFDDLSIGYSTMMDMSGEDCGGYTNVFKYVDGPAIDDSKE